MNLPESKSTSGIPSPSGIEYGFTNGYPHVKVGGVHVRHDPYTATGNEKFQDHMAYLSTPESEAMVKAAGTGHKWDVSPTDFKSFAEKDPHDIAGLVGAEPGDSIHYYKPYSGGPYDFALGFDGGHGANYGKHGLVRLKPSYGEMHIESVRAPDKAKGKGWGAKWLSDVVRAARKFGIQRINISNAAGSPTSPNMNGYYTWPRLGFNGTSEMVRTNPNLSVLHRQAKDMHQLFDMPGGAEAWKNHGHALYGLVFDTAPDSPHVQRLVRYLRSIAARRGAV